MFSSLEHTIGEWWSKSIKDEMLKAGAEERRKAIEKGHFHEGIPYFTGICDGGWSKRTHKHTYNASGGVAVIFGAETRNYCTLVSEISIAYCALVQITRILKLNHINVLKTDIKVPRQWKQIFRASFK
ncbi:hypothetical protein DPMN_121708 [Dreissena polymorpha]|uniref:Mutator-like transposase domain-containing protein n=1 Tax=Dreissena polymorpha TaxID=45954 RepID=A0A9D4JRA8_DREPO|nr:hypothetical protein DPMN_121708 [Dreissena polymorpha]